MPFVAGIWVSKRQLHLRGRLFKNSQALLLYRSRPKGVVCLLDGDAAGQKAALSYVSIFLKVGLDARFAELPKEVIPIKF